MFLSLTVACNQLLVRRIQAELRQAFVVHDDQPFVAVFDEGDIWLDETRLSLVVLQAGPGIESADVVERGLDSVYRTVDGFGDFFVLLVLHAAQMLIDDGAGILQDLCGTVAVFV